MPKEETQFKKGKSGNPSGRPKLPPDVQAARKLTNTQFIILVNKFLNMSREELKAAAENPNAPMLELIVAKIIERAIANGDQTRLGFILDRLIGKVPDKIEHSGNDGEPIKIMSARSELKQLISDESNLEALEKIADAINSRRTK